MKTTVTSFEITKGGIVLLYAKAEVSVTREPNELPAAPESVDRQQAAWAAREALAEKHLRAGRVDVITLSALPEHRKFEVVLGALEPNDQDDPGDEL